MLYEYNSIILPFSIGLQHNDDTYCTSTDVSSVMPHHNGIHQYAHRHNLYDKLIVNVIYTLKFSESSMTYEESSGGQNLCCVLQLKYCTSNYFV